MATTARRMSAAKVPTVVVVIPYYNGSDTIERAVVSVLGQTVAPNEFIIVNDGSKEEEKTFLHKLAKRYEFRIIDQANGGQGSARNAGVTASTSEYVSFLDQDDFYLKTHIQTLIEGIPENDPHFGWVYGDLIEADGDGNVIRTSMVKEHSKHPKTHILDLVRYDMHVLPSASLISRVAFEDVGGFDPQFMGYEDDDLFMRIFRKNYTNSFIDRSVTVWCIHTDSTSYSIRMSRSRLKYFKKLAAAFPDDPIKMRFFMRDILVERFHWAFVAEAIKASVDRKSKFAAHRDELLDILREYASVVSASPYVSKSFKIRLRLQIKLLSTGYPPAIRTAHFGIGTFRKFASMTRR
ncbi:glycosyltransferase family 2 protein [Phyllobacterium zundukense]|uniref:glycosyltransferase family 2 protein n=1 Tax=Phyllobacterium zundukense TaxID=1867719 RepID=UPI0021C9BBA3|nr:glycosyltransferase family A protein [Phyllobacterium zundukense]